MNGESHEHFRSRLLTGMHAEWRAVTHRQKAMASLYWTISRRDQDALTWLRQQQMHVAGRYGGCFPETTPTELDEWAAASESCPIWRRARDCPAHPWRQAWQWWIVQRSVAKAAATQLRKGLRLPAFFITDSIQHIWRALPKDSRTEDRLRALRESPHAAKNLRRQWRQAYGFSWGSGAPRRALTPTQIQTRTSIYIAWMQWARAAASPAAVYVNMDETRLSSIREWKAGTDARQASIREWKAGTVSAEQTHAKQHPRPHQARR